ncbi:MAG TPA: diaminopimelate epimerase [Acidimicrobiales bacterium]|nr:diaminopimelate epimerase [Acidimicrobiales bacterium]
MVHAAERRQTRPAAGGRDGAVLLMEKLEASGNDFLVVFVDGPATDEPRSAWGAPLVADQIRLLCDRHRGVGADGVIVARRGDLGADLDMVLYNADGTEAEMSGNGIRCLVHAAVADGIVPADDADDADGVRGMRGMRGVRVATAAGIRRVDYQARADGSGWARVDMGTVRLGREVQSPLPGARARLADVGNPHLVVIGDVELDSVDFDVLGRQANERAGGPVNLEVVRPGRAGADFELRVLERGVGETQACGTGTCAVAAVAYAFGMAGETVTVDNPGGRLWVRLGAAHGDGGDPLGGVAFEEVELAGPVRKVADVHVDPALLGEA